MSRSARTRGSLGGVGTRLGRRLKLASVAPANSGLTFGKRGMGEGAQAGAENLTGVWNGLYTYPHGGSVSFVASANSALRSVS